MLLSFMSINPAVATLPIIVIVLVWLLIWGVSDPLVWRMLSVVGMAAGGGFLVWGILLATMREEPLLVSPAATIAIGAGTLIGSIALLVISFVGRRKA